MKKMCLYITFSLFVGNFSFSSQEASVSRDLFNNSFSLFEGTILIENDSESIILRKRAHRRKRKVRPRRNGF